MRAKVSKGRLLTRARQMLGLRALGTKKQAIFKAAAERLGKPLPIGKAACYQLLQELVGDALFPKTPRRFGSTGVDVASDEFLSSYEWRRLRMVVIKKRSPRCECCGATPADGQTVINVDHIKPRRIYPELALEESNLQILCSPCNHGKGNWDETDWRDWQPPETYEPMWNRTPIVGDGIAAIRESVSEVRAKEVVEGTPGMLPRLVKRKAS